MLNEYREVALTFHQCLLYIQSYKYRCVPPNLYLVYNVVCSNFLNIKTMVLYSGGSINRESPVRIMGNQVNPVSIYWLLDFMVSRLLQEHEGHVPSYTVFMPVYQEISTLGNTYPKYDFPEHILIYDQECYTWVLK